MCPGLCHIKILELAGSITVIGTKLIMIIIHT